MAHSYRKSDTGTSYNRLDRVKKQIFGIIVITLWHLFPKRIEKIIGKQFFTPRRHRYSEEQLNFLKTGRSFDLKINEDTIKCWQWGHGPSIICIHGWNGIGLQFQSFIDAALNKQFSIIFFDAPAHGLSPGNTCSYFQMTDILRAFLKNHHRKPISGLIGHSFGAAAIINSISKEKLSIPVVLISPAIRLKQIVDAAFDQYGIPSRIYTKLIGEYEKKYGYSFTKDNPLELLDNNQSILIIHDLKDTVISYKDSEDVIHRFPDFKLLQTRNLGHKRILKELNTTHSAIDHISEFQNL
ncbi:MAG: alpha/beta hydrolase [Deltaproteobacteria bacterium]|uniref:alpha/beta hydrolase n=1 Tax=Desulfobacula sp. TaxID=2593537 RepID=UPI0019ADF424|nr:alpha/beta hydrolase [Candidatus Desulfobacula maris]MBL6995830.1 alpha/beta hydrolase [Desulfobacula sp.]